MSVCQLNLIIDIASTAENVTCDQSVSLKKVVTAFVEILLTQFLVALAFKKQSDLSCHYVCACTSGSRGGPGGPGPPPDPQILRPQNAIQHRNNEF